MSDETCSICLGAGTKNGIKCWLCDGIGTLPPRVRKSVALKEGLDGNP